MSGDTRPSRRLPAPASAAFSRRGFLAGTAGLAAGAAFPMLASAGSKQFLYVAAQGVEGVGKSGLATLDPTSGQAHAIATKARGHDVIAHPGKRGHVLMFARRPGFAAWEFDAVAGRETGGYVLRDDRQGYGHGIFSADGSVLFTCEGVIASGEGLIVVRDSQTYAVIDEWSSGGIGPHELKLLPDGKTLAIANGGTLTRPDSYREILNLDTMVSNLTYMDADRGSILETVLGPHPRASIRHIDVAANGTVALAMQFQRLPEDPPDLVPLAAVHRRGEEVAALDLPETVGTALRDYIGSVKINDQSGVAGFTSPRGNLAVFWRLDDESFAGYLALHDVCGLTVSPDRRRFVLSNSRGELRAVDANSVVELKAERRRLPEFRWDNHLTTVRVS